MPIDSAFTPSSRVATSRQERLADGTQIHVRSWRYPDGDAHPTLVLVHGHGEHMGRYEDFVARLGDLPIDIVGYDHRGHGHSDGARGDADGIDGLVADFVDLLPKLVRASDGNVLVFGHSMGGLVVARWLTAGLAPDYVRSAAISAPAFEVPRSIQTSSKIAVGRVVARVLPTASFNTGLEAAAISPVSAIVEEYVNDPLVHARISARLGRSIVDDGRQTSLRGSRVDRPVLIYHGASDRIANITGTRRFIQDVPPEFLEFHEWAGGYHEPHHDAEVVSQAVFETLRRWIGRHLKMNN